MKNRERSFDNRKPYNQSVPRESLWYYSEDPVNPSNISKEEGENALSLKNYNKMIQKRNIQLISKAANRNTFKRDIAFVVDWEVSDVL